MYARPEETGHAYMNKYTVYKWPKNVVCVYKKVYLKPCAHEHVALIM